MLEPVIHELPAHPPGLVGEATHRAALLVDRAAVQLLAACGPYDPEDERLARLRAVLADWPAVVAAMQELGRALEVGPVLDVANDVGPSRASA